MKQTQSIAAKDKYKYIAELMVTASETVLYSKHKAWVQMKHPGVSLKFRVGTGKATYHSSPVNNVGPRKHQITYGVKMVASKHSSYSQAILWTTGKEILLKGYFDKRVTLQTLLAHTILHEYAHFYQVLSGGRTRGSVHNEKFYRILNQLHECGLSNELLYYLMENEEYRKMKFIR